MCLLPLAPCIPGLKGVINWGLIEIFWSYDHRVCMCICKIVYSHEPSVPAAFHVGTTQVGCDCHLLSCQPSLATSPLAYTNACKHMPFAGHLRLI